MGSLARRLRREREREQAQAARRQVVQQARQQGEKPPPALKRHRGGMRISTPRVGVNFSMGKGYVRFGCPVCRQVLYQGPGTPHAGSLANIEAHVRLCQARRELVQALERCEDSLLAAMELKGEMWETPASRVLEGLIGGADVA
ncbi:MAG: hypothetical protein Q8O76_07770 [Chloroflexota bacterium]|nr:hypothetical protein [Chloroflexota bacterium]